MPATSFLALVPLTGLTLFHTLILRPFMSLQDRCLMHLSIRSSDQSWQWSQRSVRLHSFPLHLEQTECVSCKLLIRVPHWHFLISLALETIS